MVTVRRSLSCRCHWYPESRCCCFCCCRCRYYSAYSDWGWLASSSSSEDADRVFVVCWLFNHFWCLSLLQCSRSAFPTLDMSAPQPQRYFPSCCIATKPKNEVCRYTGLQVHTHKGTNGRTKCRSLLLPTLKKKRQPSKKSGAKKEYPTRELNLRPLAQHTSALPLY